MLIWWIYPNLLQDLREKTLVEFRDDSIIMIPLHVMERENLVAFEFFQNTFLTFCTFYISIARNQPGYSEAKKEISWKIFSELYSHLTQFYCWKILQWLFIKVIRGHDLSPRKTKANLLTLSSQRLKSFFRTWFFGHCCCPKANKLIKWRKNEKLHPNEDSLSNVNPITVASCFSVIGNKNVFWARFWFQNIHF